MVRGPRETIELHTCYDAQLARSDRREQRIKSGPAILGAADAVERWFVRFRYVTACGAVAWWSAPNYSGLTPKELRREMQTSMIVTPRPEHPAQPRIAQPPLHEPPSRRTTCPSRDGRRAVAALSTNR